MLTRIARCARACKWFASLVPLLLLPSACELLTIGRTAPQYCSESFLGYYKPQGFKKQTYAYIQQIYNPIHWTDAQRDSRNVYLLFKAANTSGEKAKTSRPNLWRLIPSGNVFTDGQFKTNKLIICSILLEGYSRDVKL